VTRKRFNVVTIAAMIAILALGSLGLGYAAWTDQIKLLDASVTTANMNVRWDNVALSETNDPYGVGACTSATGAGAHVLDINVTKGYPGYECSATGRILNDGDVPVKVSAVTFSNNTDPAHVTFTATCSGLAVNAVIAPGGFINCTASATVLAGSNEGATYAETATVDFVLQ
jgi:hypothetical protein